jgi:hypothetical protein
MAKLFGASRPFTDPGRAARRLLEHARAFEPRKDGKIDIEQLKHPFLFGDKASPAEYSAGLNFAVSQGWLELHERGTFAKVTQDGNDLFGAGTKDPPQT